MSGPLLGWSGLRIAPNEVHDRHGLTAHAPAMEGDRAGRTTLWHLGPIGVATSNLATRTAFPFSEREPPSVRVLQNSPC